MATMDRDAWYDWVSSPHPVVILISGPSGVGKDAVVKRMRELGYDFHFVVTTTAREPRAGEVDGVDYYFVSEEEFQDMLDRDEFLEHAPVYRQRKGTTYAEMRRGLESGKDVLMRLDVQGAETVSRQLPGITTVFLTAVSEEELVGRLTARAGREGMPATDLADRIDKARQEMACIRDFDYLVVNANGELDEAVRQVRVIMEAEKRKPDWRPVRL